MPAPKALLSAIPAADPEVNVEPMVLEGDVPSPVNPPRGCRFHTRCRSKTDTCTEVRPVLELRNRRVTASPAVIRPRGKGDSMTNGGATLAIIRQYSKNVPPPVYEPTYRYSSLRICAAEVT